MQTLFDAVSVEETQRRMERLRLNASALWGRMTVAQMVCHLIDGFQIPLGEKPVTVRWKPLRINPLRWLLVHVHLLPWPKGKLPTTPEFQRTQLTAWEADLVARRAAFDRFVERGRKGGPFGPHQAFGALSTMEWGCRVCLHCEHHLR